MYCDIIFKQEKEQFIRWMETLENRSHKMIYAHRNDWFQSPLELEDIEGSFASPMKIFKAGKSYIVRTTIPVSNGHANLKIYDEDERDVTIESITENTQVMVILEIQGIRCSASSFQIDIELKQMMVIKPDDLFNQFILKKKPQDGVVLGNSDPVITKEEMAEPSLPTPVIPFQLSNPLPTDSPIEAPREEITVVKEECKPVHSENDLCEVELDLDEMPFDDAVNIKDRKEMYYEMYREARQKAKVARDLALSAYLEAKRIKNTYMLDDILSSSSDEDTDEDDEDVDE